MQSTHSIKAALRNLIGRADLSNVIRDFVKKGLLEGDVQFPQDKSRDVVLDTILSMITGRLVDGNYISKCLCMLEDNGVCVHFESKLDTTNVVILDLSSCRRPIVPDTYVQRTFGQIEGQWFSDRECYRKKIIANWKFLKENLSPDSILENLVSEEIIDNDDYSSFRESSRSDKISFMLTRIVRSIENSKNFKAFIDILEKTKNGFIAQTLTAKQENNVETAEKPIFTANSIDLLRQQLIYNRNLIEKELKKPHVYVDDFLQNFILDIDEHEQFFMSKDTSKKAYAAKLLDVVLSKIDKGSFQLLMSIMKQTCNPHVFKIIREALEKTPEKTEKRLVVEVNMREEHSITDIRQAVSGRFIFQADAGTEELIRENIRNSMIKIASKYGAKVSKIENGSVIVHLKAMTGSMKTGILNIWRTGELEQLMKSLISNNQVLNNHSIGQFTIDVTFEIDNNGTAFGRQYEPEIKKEDNYKEQRNIFKVNRNFLLEEIDPIEFLDFCSHIKAIDAEHLRDIPERKVRAEQFLNCMQTESTERQDEFIDVLKEKNMNFVLRRLELFNMTQSLDSQLLLKSISDNVSSLAEELHIDDLKDFFIQNDIFQKELFEELYTKYPDDSETRIIMFIIEVLQAGESAVYQFVDALFNSDIDTSLLNELFDNKTLLHNVNTKSENKEDGATYDGFTCAKVLFKAEIIIKVELKAENALHEKSSVDLDICNAKIISSSNKSEDIGDKKGNAKKYVDASKMNTGIFSLDGNTRHIQKRYINLETDSKLSVTSIETKKELRK